MQFFKGDGVLSEGFFHQLFISTIESLWRGCNFVYADNIHPENVTHMGCSVACYNSHFLLQVFNPWYPKNMELPQAGLDTEVTALSRAGALQHLHKCLPSQSRNEALFPQTNMALNHRTKHLPLWCKYFLSSASIKSCSYLCCLARGTDFAAGKCVLYEWDEALFFTCILNAI